MDEVKKRVIEIFEGKNVNFKKSMKKEFKKKEPIVSSSEMYNYRNLLIYDILKDISSENDTWFNTIDNPMDLIEETLFTHLNK